MMTFRVGAGVAGLRGVPDSLLFIANDLLSVVSGLGSSPCHIESSTFASWNEHGFTATSK